MALGRTGGRMSSVAAKQQAAKLRAMAQRTPQQRSGLRAMPKSPTAPGPMTQQEVTQMKVAKGLDAVMPKQVAGQMAAFNAAQNKTTQGFNAAQLQQLQKEKMLREQQNQRYLGNPAAMAQLAQAPNNLQNLAAKAAQPKPTPDMSAIATPAVLSPEQRKAVMRGEKVTAPPAMRKGGAVKKKPGYAKGGMVMANCGASMKPQQKAKK